MAKLTSEQRRAVIVTAGLRVARDHGLWSVTHSSVARRCTVPTSAPTVKLYFGTKQSLWAAITEADDTGEIVRVAEAQGIRI